MRKREKKRGSQGSLIPGQETNRRGTINGPVSTGRNKAQNVPGPQEKKKEASRGVKRAKQRQTNQRAHTCSYVDTVTSRIVDLSIVLAMYLTLLL